jgi:hypothetical protein
MIEGEIEERRWPLASGVASGPRRSLVQRPQRRVRWEMNKNRITEEFNSTNWTKSELFLAVRCFISRFLGAPWVTVLFFFFFIEIEAAISRLG